VPRELRMPWNTMYVIQATTITQLSGFTLWRVGSLKQPEKQERDDLHHQHTREGQAKAPCVGALLIGLR
ncbi:MAG TPA: hypothetical protein VGM50_13055, partial [Gemmatimonadaceae bacterium]